MPHHAMHFQHQALLRRHEELTRRHNEIWINLVRPTFLAKLMIMALLPARLRNALARRAERSAEKP
jgi:hypothetical protein